MELGIGPSGRASDTRVYFWHLQFISMNIHGSPSPRQALHFSYSSAHPSFPAMDARAPGLTLPSVAAPEWSQSVGSDWSSRWGPAMCSTAVSQPQLPILLLPVPPPLQVVGQVITRELPGPFLLY